MLALAVVLAFVPGRAEAISYSQYRAHKIVIEVEPGNILAVSPAVDVNSITARRNGKVKRKTNINNKVKAAFNFFRREKELIGKLKEIAKQYKIDPMHMMGAIIGEHAFNVDVYDNVQHYVMKSIAFGGNRFVSFSCRKCGLSLKDFLELEPLKTCERSKGSHKFWSCAENIWTSTYYNKKIDKKSFPRLRFNEAFFNPYALGQTYGLGQLSPLTALKASDTTSRIGGLEKLDISNPAQVYTHIIDTDKNLHYIAATIRNAILIYRQKANFDISKNPGLVATLYNLGHVINRADALYKKNLELLKEHKKIKYPQVNYYGWFVNAHYDDLKKLLE